MIFDVAWRVGGTTSCGTRILAFKRSARLIRRTSAVPQANRQYGIAIFHAYANRLMVEHLARFIGVTGRFLTGRTRTLATTVDARRVRRALRVVRTLGMVFRTGYFPVLVNHESILAYASRLVVLHLALFVQFACEPAVLTRVVTVAQFDVARHTSGTVIVLGAFELVGSRSGMGVLASGIRMAGAIRHAHVTLRARASGSVQDGFAQGIQSTSPS